VNIGAAGDDGEPTSWRSIVPQTPVYAVDGTQIGVAQAVLGWDQEDIFHGITIRDAANYTDRMIPAARIGRMTTTRIDTNLAVDEVSGLEPYTSDATVPAYRTGEHLHVEETS
jgi:hypothetical protein